MCALPLAMASLPGPSELAHFQEQNPLALAPGTLTIRQRGRSPARFKLATWTRAKFDPSRPRTSLNWFSILRVMELMGTGRDSGDIDRGGGYGASCAAWPPALESYPSL